MDSCFGSFKCAIGPATQAYQKFPDVALMANSGELKAVGEVKVQ
jgi:hypothetical protein